MAPRYPYWITEQAPGYRGVTTRGVVLAAILTVLLVLVLGGLPGSTDPAATRRQACADLARAERMHLPHGSNYRTLRELCHG
jgi:hypothetical protein